MEFMALRGWVAHQSTLMIGIIDDIINGIIDDDRAVQAEACQ